MPNIPAPPIADITDVANFPIYPGVSGVIFLISFLVTSSKFLPSSCLLSLIVSCKYLPTLGSPIFCARSSSLKSNAIFLFSSEKHSLSFIRSPVFVIIMQCFSIFSGVLYLYETFFFSRLPKCRLNRK